jgi:spore coat polysaccharide biosynthesis protein SpsF
MKVVAIVQARMGSTHLPGKVLRDLSGRPMLQQQLNRIRLCKLLDEIVVATTNEPQDDPIIDLCRLMNIRFFRGCEHDVLARYWGAAKDCGADVIVRITADCPLIAPEITDQVIRALLDHATWYDYASNILNRTYPQGLDTEIFWRDTLERLYRMSTSKMSREHVTYHLTQEQPELFSLLSVTDSTYDASHLHWTVDTPDDLVMMKAIYRELDLNKKYVSYQDTLDFVRLRPWLSAINHNARQSA